MGEEVGGAAKRIPSDGALAVLRVPNFSLFFTGQLLSNTGTWFQNLALSLIIVEATGSASALAFVTVAQFGPLLLLAGLAGKITDSVAPKTVLLICAGLGTLTTACLAFAVASESGSLLWLYILVALGGGVGAFERVAAQAFVFELVGPSLLKNAVVLSTMYVSAARSIGPGLAGFAYLAFGPVACLVLNAASNVIVLLSMLLIRTSKLIPRRASGEKPATFGEALREVRRNFDLRVVLIVNTVVTLAAMNMNVVLTSAVSITFAGDAGQLGLMHALNAVGAVVGGYLLTRTESVSAVTFGPAMLVFSVTLAISAAAPGLLWFILAAPLLGIGIGLFQGVVQSAAQTASPPQMLGRTMSLVTIGNYGVAPFGAVLIGLLIDASSAQAALWLGAAVTFAVSATVYFKYRKRKLLITDAENMMGSDVPSALSTRDTQENT